MNLLVAYTAEKLDPRTVALIEQHVPDTVTVHWAEIRSSDERGYARLLVDAWAQPGDLMIVEHDIGIRAGVVDELTVCEQPWCGFPYRIGRSDLVCLGCTRFTHRLKVALPDVMRDASAIDSRADGGGVNAGDWRRMDVRVAAVLRRYGHVAHRHEPPVEHYHEYR